MHKHTSVTFSARDGRTQLAMGVAEDALLLLQIDGTRTLGLGAEGNSVLQDVESLHNEKEQLRRQLQDHFLGVL